MKLLKGVKGLSKGLLYFADPASGSLSDTPSCKVRHVGSARERIDVRFLPDVSKTNYSARGAKVAGARIPGVPGGMVVRGGHREGILREGVGEVTLVYAAPSTSILSSPASCPARHSSPPWRSRRTQ